MNDKSYIVYDGECPYCSRYVKMVRLRDAVGKVELVDARSDHPVVRFLLDKKVDLNEGMAFVRNGEISHGDECINKLALLSTQSGFFNRFNACVFSSPRISKALYPVLRFGRNTTLKILQITKINLDR